MKETARRGVWISKIMKEVVVEAVASRMGTKLLLPMAMKKCEHAGARDWKRKWGVGVNAYLLIHCGIS